jgi:hypothetical protein
MLSDWRYRLALFVFAQKPKALHEMGRGEQKSLSFFPELSGWNFFYCHMLGKRGG